MEREKGTNPNEPSRTVTNCHEPSQADTVSTDMDNDTELDNDTDMDSVIDTDCDSESDNDSDKDESINISKADGLYLNYAFEPSYTFEQIDILAHAVEEESNGEYPYVTRLVKKFHEINSARNWCGTDGKPIADVVRWYKQYLDYEMSNGYQLKDISICED